MAKPWMTPVMMGVLPAAVRSLHCGEHLAASAAACEPHPRLRAADTGMTEAGRSALRQFLTPARFRD